MKTHKMQLLYCKRYYDRNKEKISKKQKEKYQKNKEQINERCKNYYHKNKEKIKERYNKNKTNFHILEIEEPTNVETTSIRAFYKYKDTDIFVINMVRLSRNDIVIRFNYISEPDKVFRMKLEHMTMFVDEGELSFVSFIE